MPLPPRDPAIDHVAPTASVITAYDERHAITYLRLLDAEAAGADWKDVVRIVLGMTLRGSRSVRAAPGRLISPAPLADGTWHLAHGGAPH